MKRSSDYVFRIGGEEFAILFDIDSIEKANKVLKKIQKLIYSKKLKTYNNEVFEYLTISIGMILVNTNKIDKNQKRIYNKTDSLLNE